MTTGEPGKPGGPGGAGGAGGAGGDGASSSGYSKMDRWNKSIVWVLSVVVVLLAGLAFQIEVRGDAIAEIHVATQRVELAAIHTEQVLLEAAEQSATPEAEAQRQAIARALVDIAVVRSLLCSLPDLAEAPECR